MTYPPLQQLSLLQQPEMLAFAIRLTHDEEWAQDLLQEARYLVIKHWSTYRIGTNFGAWARRIVHNIFLSEYRKRQRRRELRASVQPAAGWMTATTTANAADGCLDLDYLTARIAALPAIYRDAFQLYLQELSYAKIALRTGVPIGTAKSRVFTARRMLRAQLAHYRY